MKFPLRRVRPRPACGRIRWRRARARRTRADFATAARAGRERSRAFVDVAAGDPRRRPTSRPSSRALRAARDAGRGIVWGIGAHVIKTGLSPILIDLMERGFVSALATNGAGVIHDFELALSGATSEDVDEALGPGRFGMAEETGTAAERARSTTASRRASVSGSPSRATSRRSQPPHASVSVLAAAARLEMPGDGARRDRHRHHPHAPGRVGRRDRRRQPARLPLFRRRSSRGSSAAST